MLYVFEMPITQAKMQIRIIQKPDEAKKLNRREKQDDIFMWFDKIQAESEEQIRHHEPFKKIAAPKREKRGCFFERNPKDQQKNDLIQRNRMPQNAIAQI